MKIWVFRCAILTICFLAAIVLDAAEQSEVSLSTHHFDLSCDKCHISQSDEKTQDQLPNTWQLKQDINKSCTMSKCHNFDPMLSHPVGIKPKGPIPEDMPLDSQAKITCLTCHNQSIDKSDQDYSDIDSGNQYLLRRPVGEQLCSSCHVNSNSTSNEHWLFSTRAHLQVSGGKSSTSNELNRPLKTIDQESRTCLTCHDDITTSISFSAASLGEKAIWRNQMKSHPIGTDYVSAVRRNPSYKNTPFNGNSRVRLFNDKIGCGSCHSLYAETQYHLVADYQDSTLCRKCHNL